MPGIVAGIIAAVAGVVVGVGGGIALTNSQGGGQFPEQAQGAIVVYGNN
jgi:hypothetical protein